MAETSETTTTQDTAAVKPKKARKPPVSREEQDRIITADSAAALALMDGIQADAEIAGIMAERGYPEQRFGEGRDLQAALQGAIEVRQTAMGVEEAAVKLLEAEDLAARTRYTDFRGTAHPVLIKASDRTTLKLSGNVPRGRGRFVTLATTSYNGTKAAPYQNILKDYGETTVALDAALKSLKDLSDADTAQNLASGDAQRATKLRDDAYKALMAWIRQLRALTRNALKQRSDLLTKLEL